MTDLLCFSNFCFALLFIIVLTVHYPTSVLSLDLTGTNLPNTIHGTMDDDKIVGKKGQDNLYGSGGDDILHGDGGDDYVDGEPGKDVLEGNDGNDIIQGGTGADKIDGGKGNDTVLASFALGSVSFRDYAADSLICGPGFDMAYINPVDGDNASSDCEVVIAETSQ